MPAKTIYVAEADLPLFDRAQVLAGGNLSAAIGQALRRYVEVRDMTQGSLRETTVRVGPPGARRTQRFVGRRLARWSHRATNTAQVERFAAYRTARDRLAVHRSQEVDWNRSGAAWEDGETYATSEGDWWEGGAARLEVYDNIEELRADTTIPSEFTERVAAALTQPDVEDLDI